MEKAYTEIQKLVADTNGDAASLSVLDKEMDEREEMRDAWIRVETELTEKLESASRASAASRSIPTTTKRVKLPDLKIKQFDGDVFKWRSFWDIFKINFDQNSDLSDVQKYSYLREYLTGKALRAVEGFEVTDDSYPKAVKTLKELFGNKDIAVQAHMSRLYNLQNTKQATDTASLERLYTEVNTHVRSLETLSENIKAFGGLIVTIMLHKLPDELILIWNREKKRSATDLEAMLTSIRDEFAARDRCKKLTNSVEPAQQTTTRPPY
jgi:hypothetical protein